MSAEWIADEVLATYTLRVIGPHSDPTLPGPRRLMDLYLPEVEENLTDLLPFGYSVVITSLGERSKEYRGSGKGVPCS